MTNIFIKNWQITLLVVILILSISAIAFSGLKLGLDFKGGTLYQIELQKQVGTDEISRIANIISRRIDPSGLMDATVTPVGGQFIAVQVSETDPAKLEQIESRIRQQGKFEATLNGETIFTGDEISRVLRGGSGYGVGKVGNVYEWRLPFVLNETASNSFTQKAFHQCSVTLGSNGKPAYDCAKTIFFLDKPEALVVVSQEQYDADTALLLEGSGLEGIPAGTSLEEVISDSQVPVVIYDQNTIFDTNLLQTTLKKTTLAIVSPDISEKVKNDLNALGFNVSVAALKQNIPWVWGVLNAKQVISLTADVTNEDVADVSQAKPFGTLSISGNRATFEIAKSDLEDLTILLESGSLPTPVKSISKETISPSLGEAFIGNILLMGIIALITVSLVILIRYRVPKLVIPIVIIGMSEIVIMLGFLALVQRPLDLAAFAGIIAAIGTGLDSEVVITDEILGKSKHSTESVMHRTKAALFIIMTSAFTIIAVMGPIILFSRNLPGLDKLFGFAVVTIFGSLAGIIITRPAFTKIIQKIVNANDKKMHEHHHAEELPPQEQN